ncbi:Cmx/CmrA family chloramphenicol efflux MFS transporter [Amycolatopsis suaedae]|uniref:MFS transporter n=1 Tax=Amycolatopsis suaedae TaxID=2510978 RepID=A0A4Q7J1V5_9PSEU|nr:Cmx/CmrA family chloramphenicol efflux MFS transporter [Amycolatopsis suaedae]RZQ59914.1 MFS transporter [Amycolatopsis suaedae]
MPLAVYLLGLAVFTQGTSEFMLSGLLPDIAADLDVTIPAAGWLTSAFAIGMVVGAPVMAVAGLRWSRRRCLTSFLIVFIAVHVIGALTTSYAVLLATRIVAALSSAGFWATALATATAMVAPAARGRATSIVVSGVTVACVAGVPAGAVLGQYWGWRSAFWAVALVSLPALVAVARSIPDDRPDPGASARGELRALRNRRLLITLSLAALVQGATFCAFTYLAPLLTGVTGLATGWVPALLALFGIGSFLGVTISGRLADRRQHAVLATGMVALLIGWSVFALAAAEPVTAVVLVLVQGVLAFGTGSALIARVFTVATEAPTLAGGLATAAFNVGSTIGPWFGGLAIGAGAGFRSPLWVSAALMALALTVAAVTVAATRRGPGRQQGGHCVPTPADTPPH